MADQPELKTLEYLDYFKFCDWAAEQLDLSSDDVQNVFINLNYGDGFRNDTHHVVDLDVRILPDYINEIERANVERVIEFIRAKYPSIDTRITFWVCW